MAKRSRSASPNHNSAEESDGNSGGESKGKKRVSGRLQSPLHKMINKEQVAAQPKSKLRKVKVEESTTVKLLGFSAFFQL